MKLRYMVSFNIKSRQIQKDVSWKMKGRYEKKNLSDEMHEKKNNI